jgi:NADPH2:quinone reductase
MVISTVQDPSLRPPRLAQVLAWANQGLIRPLVSRTYALADVKAAMQAKWQSEIVGSCVVQPPQQE